MSGFYENYLSLDGESSSNSSVFSTDQIFMSITDLMLWVQNAGRQYGYVIVTERSKKNASKEVIKVFLKCDRGGEYKGTSLIRRSGTKKTNCPFQMAGKFEKEVNGWKLRVIHAEHNHPPAQHLEGHSFAMRLSDAEMRLVDDLSKHDIQPRSILSTIRDQNPENVSSLKTVYNARQKIRKAKQLGTTPMQVLFSILHSKEYVYEHHESNGVLEELFFVHKISIKMWRAFPHVLIIDTTYKTNKYRLPFVEVVGVTPTRKTFCVAFAFITQEKEENFVWVLEKIKETLTKCMEPRVIITDRDLALINACKRIFPDAAQLLCRWHISQNIAKHCKQGLDAHDWGVLEQMWGILIESPTPDVYNYNYGRLHQMLINSHPRVLDYLDRQWLVKYKEMFVSAWVDKNLNFGNRTTNRAESQHSLLKLHMNSSNSTLDRLVEIIDKIVTEQESQINGTFEISRIKIYNHHRIPLFDLLRGNVSLEALDLISGEIYRINDLVQSHSSCGCHLRTSCGLPCACILSNYLHVGQPITLDSIDIFWRKLDLSPSFLHHDVDIEIDEEIEMVAQKIKAQPTTVKRSWLNKIKEIINPNKTNLEEPSVQTNIRGRPSLKTKQQVSQEPARHSSVVNSQVPSKTPKSIQRSFSTSSKKRGFNFMGLEEESSTHGSLILGQNNFHFNLYKEQIPSIFHTYMTRVQDVNPDGNCGFRAVAVALGYGEDQWLFIRQELLNELTQYDQMYRRVFDGTYNELRQSLCYSGPGFAPPEHWMLMPYTGFLIANRFGVIVLCLTTQHHGSTTIFPLWTPAENLLPHRTVAVCHVNSNHFIMIGLEGMYPMPTINVLWPFHRYNQAESWRTTYMERLQMFTNWINTNHNVSYVNLDD